jgi:hypothetical protein
MSDSFLHYDYAAYGDLETKGVPERYKVLVLPCSTVLSDGEVRALAAFVKRGGTLVADLMPGFYDQHGAVRENTKLQFHIIPDDGYETESVYYNDNDVTSSLQSSTYTLTVSGEGTLKVTFKDIQEEKTPVQPETPAEHKNTLNDLLLYGGISAGGLVIALILVIILRARDKRREK